MLATLRSKINCEVLALFFNNPKQSFYLHQIAREIQEDPSNLHKKMNFLVKKGILLDYFQGKERFFTLNQKYKFLKECQKIILPQNQSQGNALVLIKDFFAQLKTEKKISAVFIFNNSLKNLEQQKEIELLIKGNLKNEDLKKQVYLLEKRLAKKINSILLSERNFNLRKQKNDPLLLNALKNSFPLG